MAEFTLKDWYGKEQTFDKETIYVKGTDGELMPFVHGTVEPLEVTENGTYEAPEGVAGYNPVTVAVPDPEIVLQDKTITENGTYSADSGYDGLGAVTVDVKGGGGLAPGCYWSIVDARSTFSTICMFQYNGKLYAWARKSSDDAYYDIYLVENGVYTEVATDVRSDSLLYSNTVEYNGKLYISFEYNNSSYDENFVVTHLSLPGGCSNCGGFVMDGTLYMKTKSNGFYKLLEDGSTWEAVAVTDCPGTTYHNMVVHNRNVYIIGSGKLYKVDWDTKVCTTIRTDLPSCSGLGAAVILGDYIYFKTSSKILYKYDIASNTYQEITEIPHSQMELYVYNNKIRLSGYISASHFVHMELNEVTE